MNDLDLANAIDLLALSTASLHERFGVPQLDPQSTEQITMRQALLASEGSEMFEAAIYDNPEGVLEEAVDCLVFALGTVQLLGVDCIPWILEVIRKNDAKTHETHEYVNSKIRRKS